MGTRGNNYKILLTYTCFKTDYVVSGSYTVFKKNNEQWPTNAINHGYNYLIIRQYICIILCHVYFPISRFFMSIHLII